MRIGWVFYTAFHITLLKIQRTQYNCQGEDRAAFQKKWTRRYRGKALFQIFLWKISAWVRIIIFQSGPVYAPSSTLRNTEGKLQHKNNVLWDSAQTLNLRQDGKELEFGPHAIAMVAVSLWLTRDVSDFKYNLSVTREFTITRIKCSTHKICTHTCLVENGIQKKYVQLKPPQILIRHTGFLCASVPHLTQDHSFSCHSGAVTDNFSNICGMILESSCLTNHFSTCLF